MTGMIMLYETFDHEIEIDALKLLTRMFKSNIQQVCQTLQTGVMVVK